MRFWTRHTLYWEDDIEAAFGIFDLDETLWGLWLRRRKSFEMLRRG